MSYNKNTRELVEQLANILGREAKVDKFMIIPDFVRLDIKDIKKTPVTREQFFALLDYLDLEFERHFCESNGRLKVIKRKNKKVIPK